MEDALWAQLQNASLDEEALIDKHRQAADEEGSDRDADDDSQCLFPEAPIMPVRQSGRQTGPKGVIADHAFYQQVKEDAQQKARSEYNARMLAKAMTTTTYLEDQAHAQMELVLEHKKEDSDDDLLEDDEMLQQYREKRLAQLKQMNNRETRRQHRVFGTLEDVQAEDYAMAIDKEWRTVPVIIHLHDKSIPQCQTLDVHLRDLAQKYALAKFIRVSASDLEFDLVGSPAILAYKSGILVANLVRFVDEAGSRFSVEDVEDVLLRYGALSEDDLYEPPAEEHHNSDDHDDED
ncbi:hypothetical protein EC973_003721 [Apophysomyces ossiformis]|uniref:Phosducin domain-containing protein n=1 Tax=Apophysomyces ossiformis TaxID=679940 RepID=A0A8H7ELW1_9FUNG|nr:hypothetical protein EC973_003721 [Apophysomyces ossiformis]